MVAWTPLPEPLTWRLPTPVQHGGMTYEEITVRAPTGEDIMKATAIAGGSNIDVTHKLIEAVSGVPYDVIKKVPWWRVKQISDYFDLFTEAPSPDPLEEWYEARRLAEDAEIEARRLAALATPIESVPTEVTILS